MLLQTKWSSILNPLLSNPLVSGILLKNISLITGSNVVNHKLGRNPQGWILIDIDASASIYRSGAFNDLTLTLVSDADCQVSLYVF
jgi:hypothetical protein